MLFINVQYSTKWFYLWGIYACEKEVYLTQI